MRKLIILFLAIGSSEIALGSTLSLHDAYELAVESRSSSINARIEEEIARKLSHQRLGRLLPSLSIYSQHDWQDEVNSNDDTSRRFGESYQHTAALRASQTLFDGGKEFIALRAARALREQRKHERLLAQHSLFSELAQAFYGVILSDKLIQILEDQESLLTERTRTLRDRAAIGRSKETEVINAMSERARIIAEKLQARSDRNELLRSFEALVGMEGVAALVDTMSIENRPNLKPEDVLSAPRLSRQRSLLKLAEIENQMSLGNFLPTVDLQGRYFLDRSGVLADSKWDLSLTAEWEFFSGARDRSQRQVTDLRRRQVLADLHSIQRDELKRFEALNESISLRTSTFQAFSEAVELAERSYEAQREEFRRGLVSHLEVLQSLDALLNTRRSRDREWVALKLAWVELHLQAGRLP